jgi:hypothetical protein
MTAWRRGILAAIIRELPVMATDIRVLPNRRELGHVRVVTRDNRRTAMDRARVEGDSIVGDTSATRLAFSLSDVREVQRYRVSGNRTAVLCVGLFPVLVV